MNCRDNRWPEGCQDRGPAYAIDCSCGSFWLALKIARAALDAAGFLRGTVKVETLPNCFKICLFGLSFACTVWRC